MTTGTHTANNPSPEAATEALDEATRILGDNDQAVADIAAAVDAADAASQTGSNPTSAFRTALNSCGYSSTEIAEVLSTLRHVLSESDVDIADDPTMFAYLFKAFVGLKIRVDRHDNQIAELREDVDELKRSRDDDRFKPVYLLYSLGVWILVTGLLAFGHWHNESTDVTVANLHDKTNNVTATGLHLSIAEKSFAAQAVAGLIAAAIVLAILTLTSGFKRKSNDDGNNDDSGNTPARPRPARQQLQQQQPQGLRDLIRRNRRVHRTDNS